MTKTQEAINKLEDIGAGPASKDWYNTMKEAMIQLLRQTADDYDENDYTPTRNPMNDQLDRLIRDLMHMAIGHGNPQDFIYNNFRYSISQYVAGCGGKVK